jgi:predicted MFS family arabinose efflux permease
MALRVALGGMLALAIAMGVGRFAYTPILPAMQSGTGLGDDGAGLVATLNYLGYLLGAVAATRVPKGGVRTGLFRACLVASVGTTMAMAAVEGVWPWAALRTVSGFASAGMLILGSAIVLDRLAELGREGLLGLSFAGVGAGIAASGLVAGALGEGWRLPWLLLGAGAALLAPPVWATVRDPRAVPGAPPPPPAGPVPRPLAVLILSYACEGAGYVVTATFLVSILARLPETASVASAAWVVVGLAGLGATPLWGALGARIGPRAALALAHLVQAVAIVLPVLAPSGWAALLGAVGFGGTFMAITALAFALARRVAPGQAGRAIGVLTAAFALGQMLAPWPAGIAMARTGDAALPLAAAAGLVAFGAVLLALVAEPGRAREPGAGGVPGRG